MRRVVFWVLVLLGMSCGASSCAWAWGDSGGAGEGCCGAAVSDLIKDKPDEEQAAALQLYEDLVGLDDSRLAFLKAVEEDVCFQISCRELDPALVRQFVILAGEQQQRAQTNLIAWVGAVATAVSTFIALIALGLSVASERRSRRNEAEIAKIRTVEGAAHGGGA